MKKKLLFITIATIIALMFAVTTVMAAENNEIDDIDGLFKEDTQTPTEKDADNIAAGEENNVAENNVVENNVVENTETNTNVENNQPTELVKTGAEEVSITLVAILAISSVYAYKKVKEYNA